MLKKIRVAFYDKSGYMQNLVEYLCRQHHHAMEPSLFTSFEHLCRQAKEEMIDILLAGEEVCNEVAVLRDQIPQIVLLSEGNMVKEDQGFCKVFKYQSATEIIREVLSVAADNDEIQYTEKRGLKEAGEILSVYSPFGGAGVSQYAFTTAQNLSRQFRTLYVNLELFYGLSAYVTDKKGNALTEYRGMSEVLFYLKQKKDKLALKLESIVEIVQNLDCLLTVEDYRDLYHMCRQDMEKFLEVLLFQSGYEKLVFDIGYINDATLYLLEKSDYLYMPEAVTDSQVSKYKALERLLLREGLENIWKKKEMITAGGRK